MLIATTAFFSFVKTKNFSYPQTNGLVIPIVLLLCFLLYCLCKNLYKDDAGH